MFPIIDLYDILTLYYICYIILAMYMLGSDQEPSYNLSKNLLLLPRIRKLKEDMVDDSTPLQMIFNKIYSILTQNIVLLHFGASRTIQQDV